MTTGNITRDRTYTVVMQGVSDCLGTKRYDTIRVGTKYVKVWTGGDSPAFPKPTYVLKSFTYPIYRADGTVSARKRKLYRDYGSSGPPRKKRRQGEHPYVCDIQVSEDSPYVVTQTGFNCANGSKPYAYDTSYGQFGITNSLAGAYGPNDDIRLYGKLSDKISQEAFNMAVFLGEGKQSLQTITAAATRIHFAVKALRKGRVKAAARILVGSDKKKLVKTHKDASGSYVTPTWVAQNWLELMYGWVPLVKDIFSATAHFASMQNRPQTLTYRATIRNDKVTPVSASSNIIVTGDIVTTKTIKALVTHINEVSLLGLTDPASLAWEKLPWSFVADWVIPIGNYLEALNLNRSLTAQYVITYMNVQTVTSARNKTSVGGTYSASFFHRRVYVKREVFSSLPVPKPQVQSWDKVASWVHAANAVALLRQVFH